jgi:hypothetical protein
MPSFSPKNKISLQKQDLILILILMSHKFNFSSLNLVLNSCQFSLFKLSFLSLITISNRKEAVASMEMKLYWLECVSPWTGEGRNKCLNFGVAGILPFTWWDIRAFYSFLSKQGEGRKRLAFAMKHVRS